MKVAVAHGTNTSDIVVENHVLASADATMKGRARNRLKGAIGIAVGFVIAFKGDSCVAGFFKWRSDRKGSARGVKMLAFVFHDAGKILLGLHDLHCKVTRARELLASTACDLIASIVGNVTTRRAIVHDIRRNAKMCCEVELESEPWVRSLNVPNCELDDDPVSWDAETMGFRKIHTG